MCEASSGHLRLCIHANHCDGDQVLVPPLLSYTIGLHGDSGYLQKHIIDAEVVHKPFGTHPCQ